MSIALIALAATIAAPPLHDLDRLRAEIALFSGGVPLLDTRLALAACAAPQLAWVDGGGGVVSATCAAPAWRVFIAVQGASATAPAARLPATPLRLPQLVRRGDAVTVSAGGAGFAVAVEGVAETGGAAGARIRVRNRTTGSIILARVGADGSLSVPSLKPGNGGR